MILRKALIALLILGSCSAYSQSTSSPRVSTFEIEAPQLDTIKKIWLYLPISYPTSSKNYPVVYMHDAQNLFDKKSSYAGEWKIDESLDSLQKPEAIIVGIEHGGTKRIDELTPFRNDKYGGGKADNYIDFIINTLKPHIDTTYRTYKVPNKTAIFGSSLGGLVSFYAAIKHPETFGMAGVFSPSFWFSDEIYQYVNETDLDPMMKFYFLAGTAEGEEMIPDAQKMIELLEKKGLKRENYKAHFVEDGKHNEGMWSTYFPYSYNWLLNQK